MDSLISVIIPVYNAEMYLDECINSIINQSYKNLQIIIVDDGSTDSSPNICDYYKEIDSRIMCIHIKNGGAPNARNIALNYAKGEWISFVDADDYLERNMYEILLSNEDKSIDLFIFDKFILSKGKRRQVYEMPEDFVSSDIETIENLQLSCIYKKFQPKSYSDGQVFIWNKLYRRSIILNNNIRFPIKVYGQDDRYFNTMYFNYVRKVQYIRKCLYNYRIVDSSISHKYCENRIDWDNALYSELYAAAGVLKCSKDKLYQAIYSRIIENFWACATRCFFHKDNPKTLSDQLKYVSDVMKMDYYSEAFKKVKVNNLEIHLAIISKVGIRREVVLYLLYRIKCFVKCMIRSGN